MLDTSRWSFMKLALRTSLALAISCSVGCSQESSIRDFLDRAGACEQTSDCVIVGHACPFGCSITVHRRHQSDARSKLQSWQASSEADNFRCEPCETGAWETQCIQGQCQSRLVPDPS